RDGMAKARERSEAREQPVNRGRRRESETEPLALMDVLAVRALRLHPERAGVDVGERDRRREVELVVAEQRRDLEVRRPIDVRAEGARVDARLLGARLHVIDDLLLRKVVPLLVDAERVADVVAEDLDRRVERQLRR